jgi:hypothetical protein
MVICPVCDCSIQCKDGDCGGSQENKKEPPRKDDTVKEDFVWQAWNNCVCPNHDMGIFPVEGVDYCERCGCRINPIQPHLTDASTDNWKHRAVAMLCASCMWYVPKPKVVGLEAADLGRCRKSAPTLDGWPAVFATDWCGDHKIDEEKV